MTKEQKIEKSGILTNIYGLIDPREPELVKYIGKANNVKKRLQAHRDDADKAFYKSKKNCWIKSLANEGIQPDAILIAIVPMKYWKEMERHYVRLYKSFGADLKNGMEAGGGFGFKTKEERAKLSESMMGEKNHFYNKIHTEETKAKLTKKLNQFYATPEGKEFKKKKSEAMKGQTSPRKGVKLSEKEKQAMSERLMGEGNPNFSKFFTWINDGNKNKKWYSDTERPTGFNFDGKIQNGTSFYYNQTSDIVILIDPLKGVPEGFIKGRRKLTEQQKQNHRKESIGKVDKIVIEREERKRKIAA